MAKKILPGLFVVLCLSYLSQACYSPGTPKKVKEEFIVALEKDERPLKLLFRMVDQDGDGAKNYRFKISLTRLHSLLGIYKYSRDECSYITTDDDGYVRIERPGKKASSIAFKESDIDKYIFSKSLEKGNVLSMPKLTDVITPVEFKVIRHGPPQKLRELQFHVLTVPALDRNVFSLDLKAGTLRSESSEGAIQIEVLNAQKASQQIAKKLSAWRTGDSSYADERVDINVIAPQGIGVKETPDEHVSYVPMSGYGERFTVSYHIAKGTPNPLCFYVQDAQGAFFYWFSVQLGVGNGQVDIHPEGLTNPDGSNNLYRERWPYKDEFKRYSERCP